MWDTLSTFHLILPWNDYCLFYVMVVYCTVDIDKSSCAAKICFEAVTFLTYINFHNKNIKIRFCKYLKGMNDVSMNIYCV